MTYEIFYGTGGHSGPFNTDTEALNHGLRMGEKTMMLAARDARGVSGYLPLQVARRTSQNTLEIEGVERLKRNEIPTIFQWMVKV